MLNAILIGLGILFLILSIAALGVGLSPDEGTGAAGSLGYLIGSLIIAAPFFILGCVLLSVGLLRRPKSKE